MLLYARNDLYYIIEIQFDKPANYTYLITALNNFKNFRDLLGDRSSKKEDSFVSELTHRLANHRVFLWKMIIELTLLTIEKNYSQLK